MVDPIAIVNLIVSGITTLLVATSAITKHIKKSKCYNCCEVVTDADKDVEDDEDEEE